MENETVGTIAELLLSDDVQHYSAAKTATVDQETVSGAQSQASEDVDDKAGGGDTCSKDSRTCI